jgi:transcriptional regulator GlxA family with amidase domain
VELISLLECFLHLLVWGVWCADPPTWNVTTVAAQPMVRTGAGHLVEAKPLDGAEMADLLIVAARAGRGPDEVIEFVSGDQSLPERDLITRARNRGIGIASACAGTFLLAEAGILDGHRATTTWWLAPAFRARYPAVEVDQGRMVINSDGITTAGAAFGHVDLALAIVRANSPALADLVARYLVIERTLQRSVQRTLGTSPIRFVQDLRVERAAHLLRTTELSLETISGRVGYEHPHTLRVLLRERTGKTTAALRGA